MIILDTNVLSAIMRPKPDAAAIAWIDAQPSESIWTTSISVFEIQFGISLLATGRKRQHLVEAFAGLLKDDLHGRILPFDQTAAEAAAHVAATRRQSGRPLDFRDVQIAGIALACRADIATGNVRHFAGMGFTVIDPWAPQRSPRR